MDTFTETEVGAALCLWEATIDPPGEPASNGLEALMGELGHAQMRLEIISIAKHVEAAYVTCNDQYTDCFDWQFCPFIINLIPWDDDRPFKALLDTPVDELANAAIKSLARQPEVA